MAGGQGRSGELALLSVGSALPAPGTHGAAGLLCPCRGQGLWGLGWKRVGWPAPGCHRSVCADLIQLNDQAEPRSACRNNQSSVLTAGGGEGVLREGSEPAAHFPLCQPGAEAFHLSTSPNALSFWASQAVLGGCGVLRGTSPGLSPETLLVLEVQCCPNRQGSSSAAGCALQGRGAELQAESWPFLCRPFLHWPKAGGVPSYHRH